MCSDPAGAAPAGFAVPYVPLATVPLTPAVRDAAARIIVAVARGWTPEDVALGDRLDELDRILDDELERAEAFDFVGLVAAAVTGACVLPPGRDV